MFHKDTFPKTLPPRPLKGRWGSIEAIEKFLLDCGREELLLVYQEALLAKAQEKLGALALLAVGAEEDDVRQYQLTIGRWVTEAVKALGEWSFWLFVIVGHVSRGPLTHMMAFIMDRSRNCQKSSGKKKRGQVEEADSNNGRADPHDMSSAVVEFVTKLISSVQSEFNELLSDFSRWKQLTYLISSSKGALGQDQAFNTAVFHVLMCFADYERRIVTRTQAYPLKLAWLVAAPSSKVCSKRIEVAEDMSRIHAYVQPRNRNIPSDFEESVKFHVSKLFQACNAEFCEVISSGLLPKKLDAFVRCILGVIHLDTQEIEGCNSVLKAVAKAAPNIRLPLLSARMNIKKTINQLEENTAQSRKALAETAAQNHAATKEWQVAHPSNAKSARWVFAEKEKSKLGVIRYMPGSEPPGHKAGSTKSSTGQRDEHAVCHAKMLLLLQSFSKKNKFKLIPAQGICYIFNGLSFPALSGSCTDDSLPMTKRSCVFAGVLVLKHYSKLTWAVCSLDGGTASEPQSVSVKVPVEFLSSLDVMALLHAAAQERNFVKISLDVCTVAFGNGASPRHAGIVGREQFGDVNLLSGCRCCNRGGAPVPRGEPRQSKSNLAQSPPPSSSAQPVVQDQLATDGPSGVEDGNQIEGLDELAQQLLVAFDKVDEREHRSAAGQAGPCADDPGSDSEVDEDIDRLEIQAAEVCASSFLSPPSDCMARSSRPCDYLLWVLAGIKPEVLLTQKMSENDGLVWGWVRNNT